MTTHSKSFRFQQAFRLSALLFLVCSYCFSQDNLRTDTPFPLEELNGYSQTYVYSPGHKARAINIAEFMEQAGTFFQNEINFTPEVTLYILAPEHWKGIASEALQETYGFPHNIDMQRLAIAAEDNPFWQSFLPPLDQLPPTLVAQINIAYGKPDGSHSMMPFFDLLVLHEMGHSYHTQAGLKIHRHWMGELFVNIMLHTYIAENQPELLTALETFPNMVVGAGSAEYQFTSLEDFEKLYSTLGMGPKNYGWYQSKLHSAAKDIYNAGGKEVLKKLWNALKEHQEEMTDEAFARMLHSEVHPEVAAVYFNWSK